MTINVLSTYEVTCDACGCGEIIHQAEYPRLQHGWVRVQGANVPGRDLCPTCAAREGKRDDAE